MILVKTTILLLVLINLVGAWSPGHQPLDRKSFLQKTGTAAVVVGTGDASVVVENAQAAATTGGKDKGIYKAQPNSLKGQVHVITGASTGLGLESVKRLAAGGATVVLTTRNANKGERAKSEVQEYLRNEQSSIDYDSSPQVYYLTLDLDDFDSIRSFPNRYKQTLGNRKIDVLMNNAGVAAIPNREVTKEGFERTFQSNHLGPFLLTSLLFSYMNRDGSRIINVSSNAHYIIPYTYKSFPGLDLDNLNGDKEYVGSGWGAYGNTKLENILFTQELQRRADAADLSWLTVVCLHPGVVGTDIWRSSYLGVNDNKDNTNRRPTLVSLQAITSTLFYNNVLTIEEGANTQIMLAAATDNVIAKGQYYDEKGRVAKLADFARDQVKAEKLWEASEKMSGTVFKVE